MARCCVIAAGRLHCEAEQQVRKQQYFFYGFMRSINKDELYDNLREFLKTKGVSLQDGSYTRGIQAGCSFLADAINLSQAGLNRAKTQIEKQLDNARQIIHEKTAKRSGAANARPGPKAKQGGGSKGPGTANRAGARRKRRG